MKRTSFKTYTKRENEQFLSDIKAYYQMRREEIIDSINDGERESVALSLLDSSLITATKRQYQTKIICCGDYVQVYYFNKTKTQKKKELKLNDDKKNKIIDVDFLFKEENHNRRHELNTIEYKNIMRSKFQLQRLVKSNEDIFKTFITLTFEENLKDIDVANQKFKSWRTKIKSIFKDFKYICVPEFQKRGAVHYHLLTNLEIDKTYTYVRLKKECETKLITTQTNFTTNQLNKMTLEQRKKCYDVSYWPHGYTSVFSINSNDVVAYMTKYMTKDIDNRLFGHRRYFNSYNLKQPQELFLDNLNSDIDFLNLIHVINNYDETFKNEYLSFDGDTINFVEYKKRIP